MEKGVKMRKATKMGTSTSMISASGKVLEVQLGAEVMCLAGVGVIADICGDEVFVVDSCGKGVGWFNISGCIVTGGVA